MGFLTQLVIDHNQRQSRETEGTKNRLAGHAARRQQQGQFDTRMAADRQQRGASNAQTDRRLDMAEEEFVQRNEQLGKFDQSNKALQGFEDYMFGMQQIAAPTPVQQAGQPPEMFRPDEVEQARAFLGGIQDPGLRDQAFKRWADTKQQRRQEVGMAVMRRGLGIAEQKGILPEGASAQVLEQLDSGETTMDDVTQMLAKGREHMADVNARRTGYERSLDKLKEVYGWTQQQRPYGIDQNEWDAREAWLDRELWRWEFDPEDPQVDPNKQYHAIMLKMGSSERWATDLSLTGEGELARPSEAERGRVATRRMDQMHQGSRANMEGKMASQMMGGVMPDQGGGGVLPDGFVQELQGLGSKDPAAIQKLAQKHGIRGTPETKAAIVELVKGGR